MSSADNFLALEPELVERLRTRLAGLTPPVHVLTAADLDGVTEEKQLVPAVHVVYQAYRVAESRDDGLAARVDQTWLAVVTTRNARGLKSGAAARSEAGPLARKVAAALMGWRPPSASKPLRLVDGPGAGLSAGFAYLPLAFKAETLIKAVA